MKFFVSMKQKMQAGLIMEKDMDLVLTIAGGSDIIFGFNQGSIISTDQMIIIVHPAVLLYLR
jgi:hypothetical protein